MPPPFEDGSLEKINQINQDKIYDTSSTIAPLPAAPSGSPPLWIALICFLPVIAWGVSWLYAVGSLHGSWASLWACTFLAATAWADIAPGSPAGSIDYTDMALRSIHRGPSVDPLGLLHAPPHQQYNSQGQPWALDAWVVRALLPLAHKGWVAGRSVAAGPGALAAVAAAQLSLMAASLVFLAVQTPVGPVLAGVGTALGRLGAVCGGLVQGMAHPRAGGGRRGSGQDGARQGNGGRSSGGSVIEGSSGHGSRAGVGDGGDGEPAGTGSLSQPRLQGPGASVEGRGEIRQAGSGGGSIDDGASGGATHRQAFPPLSAALMRTAAQLGLVALSTFVAASETAVPVMAGEWATQPATLLYVLAVVVGDLVLPAAVSLAAVASVLVGLWQGLRERAVMASKGGAGAEQPSSRGSGGSGRSMTSSEDSSGSSSSNQEGGGGGGIHPGAAPSSADRTPADARLQGDSAAPASPSTTSFPRSSGSSSGPTQPRWLWAALLTVYAARGLLDAALTAAVAAGWLGGQVSAVRIVALLLLLRICWAEYQAMLPRSTPPEQRTWGKVTRH